MDFRRLSRQFPRLITVPLLLQCGFAAAEDKSEPSLGPVVCKVTTLMICKEDFCTYLPDDEGVQLLFDFNQKTYVNPAIGKGSKPMENVAIENKGAWYQAKFTIEMPHGRGNVTFNKTAPIDGPSKMSAANVFSYPDDPGKIITGMRCTP